MCSLAGSAGSDCARLQRGNLGLTRGLCVCVCVCVCMCVCVCGVCACVELRSCQKINRPHAHAHDSRTHDSRTNHSHEHRASNGTTTLNSRSRHRRPQDRRCPSCVQPGSRRWPRLHSTSTTPPRGSTAAPRLKHSAARRYVCIYIYIYKIGRASCRERV